MEKSLKGMGKDNSHRKYPGERGPRPDRAQQKREEAQLRNAMWAERTISDQLRSLDARLGKGAGAARQRARIAGKKAA